MIHFDIPGREQVELAYLVLDFNGTLAFDGQFIAGVPELLTQLAEQLKIYICTADTYQTVQNQCHSLPVEVKTFPQGQAAAAKLAIVEQLGADQCVAIGNGYNDLLMIKQAALSVAVIEGEGTYGQCLYHSDIVCRSVGEALDLLNHPQRVKATLRH